MKKLIINMLLVFGITTAVSAQAYDVVPMAHTPVNQPDYNPLVFYPNQNLYDTEMYRSYWAWDKTSSTWVKKVELIAPYQKMIIVPNIFNNKTTCPDNYVCYYDASSNRQYNLKKTGQ